MSERKTFSGEEFSLNRWGDKIFLREARKGEICTEIREFIPDKESSCEAQNAEYMLISHGLQPELTKKELNEFALKILILTGFLEISKERLNKGCMLNEYSVDSENVD
ncbi:hypothetical protein [Enterococcus faecalis]|uniref:hypothetical protein n=1 Tax=Enterococcus faecalis TaxID=1351 RepID=UPI000459B5DE|nr:hypothetical protein [Enterococcus faecalis]KAJ82266.1 hypothetical protein P791_2822 [Enterococcus faecalis NY9]